MIDLIKTMINETVYQFLSVGSIITFFVLIVALAILSWVLNYHWTRCGISPKNLERVRWLYFGISFILLVVMVIAIMFLII